MKDVILVGAGGFAKEMLSYIKKNHEYNIVGYVSNEENSDFTKEFPYFGIPEKHKLGLDLKYLLAIGNQKSRKYIIDLLGIDSFDTYIDNSAIVNDTSVIGHGTVICPNVIIGPHVTIGALCLINYNVFIPHDCVIGKFSIFSPGTNIGGEVRIGAGFFSGLSSTIIPRTKIVDNVKVSAGAVVTKSLSKPGTYFGNPAQLLKV
jgi:acetyltransferase EpsM